MDYLIWQKYRARAWFIAWLTSWGCLIYSYWAEEWGQFIFWLIVTGFFSSATFIQKPAKKKTDEEVL
jgi:hypothetical protein